jgi:hypothetical protein
MLLLNCKMFAVRSAFLNQIYQAMINNVCRRLLSSSTRVNFEEDTYSINFRTCRKTYSDRKGPSYLFRNCPKEGIDIDVTYYDSNPTASSSTPTIAAFHGVPGSFRVFGGIIPGLRSKGYRVIAPAFPGNITLKTYYFYDAFLVLYVLCSSQIIGILDIA